MVSRAITREPTAACTGTSNCCRGISSSAWRHHDAVGVGLVFMHDRGERIDRFSL
jgi:hypothetical protein